MADGPTLIELPIGSPGGGNHPLFGSDLLAVTIRTLGIERIAGNPRGELPQPARQPGQLPRQSRSTDTAVFA